MPFYTPAIRFKEQEKFTLSDEVNVNSDNDITDSDTDNELDIQSGCVLPSYVQIRTPKLTIDISQWCG